MMGSIKETAVSKYVVTLSRYKGPEDDRPPLQPNVAFQGLAFAGFFYFRPHGNHPLRALLINPAHEA